MATNTGKRRMKWLRYVLMGVAGLGLYHVLTGPSGTINLLRLKREKAKMEADLDSLTRRKRDLQVEKSRLERDSAYIERVARKELGMARPDEKVFRFVPPKDPK
jgi:cell division protein FtsB